MPLEEFAMKWAIALALAAFGPFCGCSRPYYGAAVAPPAYTQPPIYQQQQPVYQQCVPQVQPQCVCY